MATILLLVAVLMYLEGILFWAAISTMLDLFAKPVSFWAKFLIVMFWPVAGPVFAVKVYHDCKGMLDSAKQFQNILSWDRPPVSAEASLISDDETASS